MPERRTVQQLKEALESETPPLLVDVRTAGEFRSVRLQQARNVPLHQLAGAQGTLPKDQPIWLLCRSGNRSRSAAAQLEQSGFVVIDVQGGMNAWQAKGWATEGEGPSPVQRLLLPIVGCLTIGLAPHNAPHIIDKIRRVAAGAGDMAPIDWFDLAMHGAPWVWLLLTLGAISRGPASRSRPGSSG